MFQISSLVGGIVGIYVLQQILEWLIFKRIFNDPLKGKVGSTLAAYFCASIIYGFTTARGGPWRPDGFFLYFLGMLVVGFFATKRGLKLRDTIDSDDSVADAFK
ncbi:hypothetical protein [Novosphingobium sp. PASSN1]|uniref:hypothetical protein n=1 Tax=Novosphingobium sp. PASSN1 TaxID=2015561 RepID=UPI0025D171A0|nr:hypothetical protein [Novosphingobium sp. PASSN1]